MEEFWPSVIDSIASNWGFVHSNRNIRFKTVKRLDCNYNKKKKRRLCCILNTREGDTKYMTLCNISRKRMNSEK
uniref:Uncharacterized protein n=1 Tax=Glycine max TaxID=3847 RepID=K7MEC1_SOYBN